MKKVLVLCLAIVMCVSLCACGNNADTQSETDISTSSNGASENSKSPDVLDINDIAGYWYFSIDELWDSSYITINKNLTFDHGDAKGTVSINNEENSVTLQYRLDGKKTFKYYNNYIYDASRYFDKDDEYGLAFSPDTNGRTDQTFYINANGFTITEHCSYTHFSLDFNNDGTYVMKTGWLKKSDEYYYHDFDKTVEGSYTYEDSVITLTAGSSEYHIIVGENNQLYYLVYEH